MLLGRPRVPSRITPLACAALILLLAPGEALADGFKDKTPLPVDVQGGKDAAAAVQHSSSGGAVVRMIVGLLIVIAVIYGVYWLLKTYSKSKKSGTEGDGKMDIVATTVLGPNRSMHLVRVGDELVLVGAAEQGVTPIRIYSAEEAAQLGPQFEEPTDLRAVGGDAGKGGPTIARLIDDLRRRTAR